MEVTVQAIAGLQYLLEQARGARPRVGHVDVRIGAVRDHRVHRVDHGARHVGVQIQAGRDRHAPPDHRAHAAQDLALAVLEFFRHHGAVQVEVYAVDRQRLLEVGDHLAGDAVERFPGDVRRGTRRGPGGADQAVSHRAQRLDCTSGRNVGAFHRAENGLAVLHSGPAAAGFEGGIGCLRGGEGIGLVLEAADGDSTHGRLELSLRRRRK